MGGFSPPFFHFYVLATLAFIVYCVASAPWCFALSLKVRYDCTLTGDWLQLRCVFFYLKITDMLSFILFDTDSGRTVHSSENRRTVVLVLCPWTDGLTDGLTKAPTGAYIT